MKTLMLDDFKKYASLSGLATNDDHTMVAYLKHTINLEDNCYASRLWLTDIASGKNEEVDFHENVSWLCWLEVTRLAFAAVKDQATHLYCYNTVEKTVASLGQVGMAVHLEGKVNGTTLAVTGTRNLQKETQEAYMQQAGLAQYSHEGENCIVFDEYPFAFNGLGITNKLRDTLYLLDLKTCALKQLTFGMVKVDQVAIHPNGTEIAFSGIDYTDFADYRYGLYRYNLAEDKTRCVFEPGKYHIAQMVYLNDHKLMFVAGKHEKEAAMQCPEFMLVDLATDGVTLLCNQDLSVGNSIGSDCRYGSGQSLCVEGEKIYFISVIEDASCILSCDKQGTLQTVVANGGSIDMFDIKGDCIAYVGMHDMHLQEVYLYDIRQDRRPRCLTGHNDDVIKACPPLMPEKLQFQNANGDEIHGFVIKPANYNENEKYPAILDIHGGPRVAYGAVYFHEMQLWARMGYFVFFCNPTGSDGRGNKFWLGGRFGTIDYDDLMQFTDVVLEKYPQIDKKRVGVTGGSYGGFMTNWIIGHTNRFAAAASQRSIANNVTMELTTDLGILHASQQIYSSTFIDYQYVWNTSPLKYAGNVTTPTLFIHSSEDWRCGPAEGLQMYTALKFHGIETRLCLFMGENHELSRSGHPKARVRRLAEITAWMEQHLKATR